MFEHPAQICTVGKDFMHRRQRIVHVKCVAVMQHGYGSIPIHTIFRGMNIHLPAILMFTRGTRFWHTATWTEKPAQQTLLEKAVGDILG
jgi:hypothetical protein